MEILSVVEAQKSIEHLQNCPGLRCVLDSFSSDLSKNLREDIYIFLKDSGKAQVLRACEKGERPKRSSGNEVCYQVQFQKAGEIQVLWKNEKGEWKLSNSSKRPLRDADKNP
ncbi:hypothetical protein [Bdellovibrio sp.]|uniref:hypothetical protein n=1 Tax=Bdellovibrio sp. TaxID=28201 RepID=UPI0039E24478